MLPRSIYLALLNHSYSQTQSSGKTLLRFTLFPNSELCKNFQCLFIYLSGFGRLSFNSLCFLLFLYSLHHISVTCLSSSPSAVLDLFTSHPSNWTLVSLSCFWVLRKVILLQNECVCFMLFFVLFSDALRSVGLLSVPGDLVGHTDFLAVLSSAPTTLHLDSTAPALHLAVDADSEDASVAQGFSAQHQPVVKLLARLLPPRCAPTGRQAYQAPGARVQLPATAETPAGPQSRSAAARAPTPAWPRPWPGACPRAPTPTRPRRHRRRYRGRATAALGGTVATAADRRPGGIRPGAGARYALRHCPH